LYEDYTDAAVCNKSRKYWTVITYSPK
jgi:hypothetical protein